MSKSKLEKTERDELATIPEPTVGLEDIDADDLPLPMLRIDHDSGEFVADGNVCYSEVDVVILGIKKTRVMFPKFVPGQNADPLCKSNDFYHSIDGKNCFSCPNEKWSYNEKEDKSEAPPCSIVWLFPLLIEGDIQKPAILSIKRTSLSPARGYVAPFVREHLPLFSCYTLLSLEDCKTFYKVKFEQGLATSEDLQRVAQKEWLNFRSRFIHGPDQPENSAANVVEVITEEDNEAPL